MTRTRATAKKAGSSFERSIADYLAVEIDDRIDRKVKTGRADRGDIGGVRLFGGGRMTLELKDYAGSVKVKPWLDEAEVERGNDDGKACAVIVKRRLIADPAEQLVMMTVRDLVTLLTGERP